MDNWFLIGLAGVLSGAVGSLGIGGGGVLIVFLTLIFDVKQITAQGINLMFFIPIACFSVIIYFKQKLIDLKQAVATAIPGILGVLIGIPIAKMIGNDILPKIFGGILIAISIKELFFGKTKRNKS